MRILYIHQYFCTPEGGGGVRSYEFARRWVAAGHEVVVVTGSGYDAKVQPGYSRIEGIAVHCLGGAYDTNFSFGKRLWSFFKFAVQSSIIAARAKGFDVVLATSTPLTVALPGLAAKWIARRPLVFEVRDVWPDAAVDIGALKNPALIWLARVLEKVTYRNADAIVPLSTGMEARLRAKGVPAAKMTVISNCSDLEFFGAGDGPRMRAEHHADEKKILLYVGAINQANNIEHLISIAEHLPLDGSWEWWIVGDGNRYGLLQDFVARHPECPLRLFGRRPRDEIRDYMAAADVGIVAFVDQPVYFENSPNKFFDYIAAGLPVFFTRSTWLQSSIEEFDCGVVCEEQSPVKAAAKLLAMCQSPHDLRRMGVGSRRLAESRFSRDLMAEHYLDLFQNLHRNQRS